MGVEFHPKLCYANTFVLVDVRIAEEFNQNISYVKGLFLNKALVKETDLDDSTVQHTKKLALRCERAPRVFWIYSLYLTYCVVVPCLFFDTDL